MKKYDNLRCPKGTIDLSPHEMRIKNQLIDICKTIFERHGGQPIFTPVFELRENLYNQYGEDEKLIFNLEDQKGDICSLRYDLTVPFARFISKHKISRMRKWQIGEVYRRDNPSKGRLREFTQADFDITGTNLPMVYDSEILKMVHSILETITTTFSLKGFMIKINDRRIVDGYLETCGIFGDKKATICSTIDKFDKLTLIELKIEFKAKGLTDDQINMLFNLFTITRTRNNEAIIEYLESIYDKIITIDSMNNFKTACEELKVLFRYLSIMNVYVTFDLTLVRGLSYYTGLIFEGTLCHEEIGSVTGGGRYDNLCHTISNFNTPCVGFSIGISRLLTIILKKQEYSQNYCSLGNKDVLVGSLYGLLIEERMEIFNEIIKYYSCEIMYGTKMIFNKQIEYAKKAKYKLIVFTGINEKKTNTLVIYVIETQHRIAIDKKSLITELNKLLK